MTDLVEIENRATLARITCGWKKRSLPLDAVRRYWRDVHSPAITRRAGVYDYRHSQFDAVRSDLFPPIEGVQFECPGGEQLMWLSDVRYRDAAGLAAFDASPPAEIKPHLLQDIELIVDRSTTYRAVGANGHTFLDRTGIATPQGPPRWPSFGLFLRRRAQEDKFRARLREMAERWASTPGVLRLRLSLFDAPDMEAERRAGYPVKTHAEAQQYQAWIDLVLESERVAGQLIASDQSWTAAVTTLHAYPVHAVYTSVYRERPTVVGLRGYAAHQAIEALNASNQKHPDLLEWMYGAIVQGGPIEGDEP